MSTNSGRTGIACDFGVITATVSERAKLSTRGTFTRDASMIYRARSRSILL
jgi:hypothetical protein